MTDRKSQIMLNLDEYRMLKALSLESRKSIEKVIRQLLQIIYERVDYAYETGEVPAGMDGYSLMIFTALHLLKVGVFTEQEFKIIIENKNLHDIVDKVFDAEGLKNRRKIMDSYRHLMVPIRKA